MYDFQACLNLLRFNMVWIVTIHRILKHVWTCWNMSEPVETCLNFFRFNMIWINAILKHVWTCTNLFKLVQIQYDMNCYDSYMSEHVETCLNLFRFNMIWIDTILKHVWTCSNMSKLVQNHEYDTNWYNSWTCQDWKWKHGEIH